VSRPPRTGTGAALTAVMLLVSASGVAPQRGELHLTVETPASLAPAAERVRRVDRKQLTEALTRAGITTPSEIRVTLIAEDDRRARATPVWIVGVATGQHDIAIFPERIGVYPVRLAGVGRLARGRASGAFGPGWRSTTAARVPRRCGDVG
jgi:hypothetical protein